MSFVAFQFKLSCGVVKAVEALHYDNLMKGIVTLDFMESAHFSKSYIPGIYEPHHALKLFQSLFIASPLSNGEYLLPFLLPTIPKTDIQKYRPASSTPALMILFKTVITSKVTCAPNGIFCGLVACLMTTYKWIIKQVYDESKLELRTECMARNVVILIHDNLPGTLTLINMQSFFEVYVEADKRMLMHLCPKVREMIVAGIKSVSTAFKYVDCIPTVAYRCPCSPDSHPAEPKAYFGIKTLHCTQLHSDLAWTESYEIWGEYGSSLSSPNTAVDDSCRSTLTNHKADSTNASSALSSKLDTEPTISELTRFETKSGLTIEIIDSLAPKWEKFASLLNFDPIGRQLNLIQCERRSAVDSCRDVMKHWLRGNGEQPTTWRTLVAILRSLSETKLAASLEETLC